MKMRYLNAEALLYGVPCRYLLPLITLLVVALAQICVFIVVPDEKIMGAVYRILYFHVGSAFATYSMLAALFTAGVFYLHTRDDAWDALGEASATVAFLFATVVLVSGMIWGNSAWNTIWRWEPRLVSFLVLWLILLSYILLRSFTDEESRRRNYSAIVGIVAAVNVPIVIYSIKLLDQSQQLHPQVVSRQGLRDVSYVYTLVLSIIAVLLLAIWLLVIKTTALLLERRLQESARNRSEQF